MMMIKGIKHKIIGKIPKMIFLCIAVFALFMFLFGIPHLGIMQEMSNQLGNCPFMDGNTSICSMSPMDHIKAWQNMFVTLPIKDTLSLLFLSLALLVLFGLKFFKKSFFFEQSLIETYGSHLPITDIFIFNSLKEAFSRGILNPKTF
jgi:hypothetical protein